jgi:hypothetical protein
VCKEKLATEYIGRVMANDTRARDKTRILRYSENACFGNKSRKEKEIETSEAKREAPHA